MQYPHHPVTVLSENSQYHYAPAQNLTSNGYLPSSNVQESGQPTNVYSFTANRKASNATSTVDSATRTPLTLDFSPSSNGRIQPPTSLSAPIASPIPPSRLRPLRRQSFDKDVAVEQTHDQLNSEVQNSAIQPNKLAEIRPSQPTVDTTAMSDLEDGELSDGGSASEEVRLETERKRNIARDALRQLHENNIGFLEVMPDIVLDGYSATLLKQLYSEIGISISSSDMAIASALEAKHQRNGAGPNVQAKSIGRHQESLNKPSTSISTQTATDTRSRSNADNDAAIVIAEPDGEPESRVTHRTETTSAKAPIQAAKPVAASNASSRNQITTPTSATGIPKGAKSSEKTFDRKDYIARMLAAKSNKSQSQLEPPSPASVSPKSNLITVPPAVNVATATPKAAQNRKENAAVEASPVQTAIQKRSPIIKPLENDAQSNNSRSLQKSLSSESNRPQLEQTDAEAKKKAQTELARQKMEALKNREHLQRKDKSVHSNSVYATVQPPTTPITSSSNPLAAQASQPSLSATVKEQIATAPQLSYFFPVSGKQPFNLPGLFMSKESLTNGSPLQPSVVHDVTQPGVQSSTSVASALSHPLPDPPVTALQSSHLPGSDATPKPTLTEVPEGNVGNKQVVNSSRKRNKAADFLDPPSTRIKRYLGPSKDQGVVIEVSDDEAFDGLDGDDERMDIDIDQAIYGNMREHPIARGSSQQIDRQLERRESDNIKPSVNHQVTPPLAQPPGKVGGLDGLNSMEKKIELMNRKIAELEQRRKAKQSSSRAQTPAAVGTRSVSPKLGQVAPDTVEKGPTAQFHEEQSTRTTEMFINDGANDRTSRATTTSTPERLSNKDRLKHAERERERQLEIEHSRQTEAKRLQELEAQQLIAIEQKRAKELEEYQARKEEEQRARQLGEQKLKDLEQQRDKEQELARMSAERQQAIDDQEAAQLQRNLEREAAIEAGLPLLDAEVDKTQQKLQLLKQEVRELEFELERGIEGRRNLFEELQSLKTISLASRIVERDRRHGLSDKEGSLMKANTESKYQPSSILVVLGWKSFCGLQTGRRRLYSHSLADADVLLRSSSAASPSTDADANSSTSGQGEVVMSENRQTFQTVSQRNTVQTWHGELAGDTMDISRSDIDEGEVTDYSPQALATQETEPKSPNEHEDIYEPPQIIDAGAGSSSASREDSRQPDLSGVPAVYNRTMSLSTTEKVTPSPHTSQVPRALTNESDKAGPISESSGIQPSSDGMSTSSDDYEPPEPASPKETWSVSRRDQVIGPKPKQPSGVQQDSTRTRDSSQQASLRVHDLIKEQTIDNQQSIPKVGCLPFADGDTNLVSSH